MTVSLGRLARNQVIFREVNERLHEIANAAAGLTEFLCECSDTSCTATIELEETEYEAVRSMPNVFAIVPGHETPAVERVIEEHERFVLVEKFLPVDDLASSHGG